MAGYGTTMFGGIANLGNQQPKVKDWTVNAYPNDETLGRGLDEGNILVFTNRVKQSKPIVSAFVSAGQDLAALNATGLFGTADTSMPAYDNNTRNRNELLINVIQKGTDSVAVMKDLVAVDIPINTMMYIAMVDSKGNRIPGVVPPNEVGRLRLSTDPNHGPVFGTLMLPKTKGQPKVFCHFAPN